MFKVETSNYPTAQSGPRSLHAFTDEQRFVPQLNGIDLLNGICLKTRRNRLFGILPAKTRPHEAGHENFTISGSRCDGRLSHVIRQLAARRLSWRFHTSALISEDKAMLSIKPICASLAISLLLAAGAVSAQQATSPSSPPATSQDSNNMQQQDSMKNKSDSSMSNGSMKKSGTNTMKNKKMMKKNSMSNDSMKSDSSMGSKDSMSHPASGSSTH